MQSKWWMELREQIPAAEDFSYLISSAAGPLHPRASRRSKAFLEQLEKTGDIFFEQDVEEIERVRTQVARFLNAKPEEIAFVSSSSMAMNIFALMQKRRGEDIPFVLAPEHEFPSSTLAWLRQGYELEMIESEEGRYPVSRLLSKGGRDLVASSVQYSSGYHILDEELLEWKRLRSGRLYVNGTQGFTARAMDTEHFDFFCASIHKWPMAGFGLSVIKISEEYLDDIPFAGWTSQKDLWSMNNRDLDMARRAASVELGCLPMLQIFSLGAVIEWIFEIGGVEEIQKRNGFLLGKAKSMLKESGFELRYDFDLEHSAPIIFLEVQENPDQLVAQLADRGVHVSARAGALRLSLHCFNTEADIEKFISVYREIAAS